MVDILDSIAEEPIGELHLKHPKTEEPLYAGPDLPIVAVVYGRASKQFKEVADAQFNRIQRAKNKVFTAEELEALTLDRLSKLVKEIRNLSYEGSPLNTPEVIRAFLADPKYVRTRAQIDDFSGVPDGFFK